MAGHSHSANIKHRKNAVDGKRAKIFSKLARNLISAVRQGGDDAETNLKLKYAVEKAKAANMPKDNIERAIKKGAGDKSGDAYEELIYEGYAPGGVALLISCLTDNRNRTAPDVKYTLDHCGGNLGSTGSVAFMFNFRSIFVVEMGERDEDQLMEIALEAGAEDVDVDGDVATIEGAPGDFLAIKEALEAAGLEMLSAETGYLPQTTAEVTDKDVARRILKLIDTLEDNEDVQNVYANYDMPDEWQEELRS
ncbi:MAG: YebC/PmpR family DNA-binding transcriptional regulator [Planctomycetes bacterium]|nr:YebC/PmpR family DNA-binding transcriptional regulator [Planctomycetota bacterium]